MEEVKISSEKDIDEKPASKRRTKKAKEDNVVLNEAEELRAKIKALEEELARRDAETKRLLELSGKVLETNTKDKESVLVKCLELNGVELSSINRDTVISLPYDVWVDCDVNELNQIFKKVANRELFEDGICIMEEGALEKFRIKQKVVIDIDKIISLLDTGDENKIVKEFNTLTSNKKKSQVGHLILYSIVGKSLDGELDRIPRASISAIEQYFGIKMKDVEMLLKIFRDVKA
jgi:hypothetical protein